MTISQTSKPPIINPNLSIRCKPIKVILPTAQSDPDSQTNPHQARNSASGCNATPSHDRHTGFAVGRIGERYPLPWFPLLDDPSQCSCRTKPDYLHHRSSLSGCRFGRSGSSGFASAFRLRRTATVRRSRER